jgi:hypothetical protein
MKKLISFTKLLFPAAIILLSPAIGSAQQIDTLFIQNASVKPNIDAEGTDACWTGENWHPIDQVWINYGENIDSTDFFGRFKSVWSSTENLLYFLVEVTDDVAIGGFIENQTAAVYNYDIVEVFIDEDRSGGPHIEDDAGTGENGENAFSYHIYADFPSEGGVEKDFWVGDIPRPYTEHIGEFALRKTGNSFTREFSVKVYDDTYETSNPETSRVTLAPGKLMGLSLAYCDNDEDDGNRDNFFGSVWVSEANNNSHWMNADDFNPAKLLSDNVSSVNPVLSNNIDIFPNPANAFVTIKTSEPVLNVEVLDISGRIIKTVNGEGALNLSISTVELNSGAYFLNIYFKDSKTTIRKLIID